MVKLITTIVFFAFTSVSGFAADNQKDGQGCMFSQTKGSCAAQLISPQGKSKECELHTEGTTQSGRKVKSVKTVILKPLEVQSLDVHTSESDPFVKLDGWTKCQ